MSVSKCIVVRIGFSKNISDFNTVTTHFYNSNLRLILGLCIVFSFACRYLIC